MIQGTPYFIDETHQYFDDIGELESVSRFVKQYYPEFDDITNSKRMMFQQMFEEKYNKVLGRYKWHDPKLLPSLLRKISEEEIEDLEFNAEELRNDWIKNGTFRADLGTQKHDLFEDAIGNKDWTQCPFDGLWYKVMRRPRGEGFDNQYNLPELLKVPQNMFVQEMMLVDPDTRNAGQADKVWMYWNGKRHIGKIGDYKSDDVIDRTRFMTPRSFNAPFLDISSSKIGYYTFKMSIYKIMAEKAVLPIEHMYLYHVPIKTKRTRKKNKYYRLGDYSQIIKERTM